MVDWNMKLIPRLDKATSPRVCVSKVMKRVQIVVACYVSYHN